MKDLKTVYERQQALLRARDDQTEIYDRVWWESEERDISKLMEHPDVKAARAEVARLEAEVADLQQEVGGKVYRVAGEKLDALKKRIATLNRKAEKLGTDPIEMAEGETEEETCKEQLKPGDDGYLADPDIAGPDYKTVIYNWVYVVISGKTPMVPGYAFIASLDHTIQGEGGDPVTINRVPGISFHLRHAREMSETEAQELLDQIDLSEYRFAENRCDHCGYVRRRNQTYIVYDFENKKSLQVGSTCLKDFTGANNPHAAARWAEYLAALDRDLGIGGEAYGGYGTGRTAWPIVDYMAYAVACARINGWHSRWADGERRYGTADEAWTAMTDRKRSSFSKEPQPTDKDFKVARDALDWVREDLAERDEELSEFDHNLVAVSASDFMPEKGDGFVAYIPQAWKREQERRIEAERETSPVPVTDERIKITGVITKIAWKDSAYSEVAVAKMTVLDDRGFKVWGTRPDSLLVKADDGFIEENGYMHRPAEEGDRVTFMAKVKPGDRDESFGFFNRPTQAEVIDAPSDS